MSHKLKRTIDSSHHGLHYSSDIDMSQPLPQYQNTHDALLSMLDEILPIDWDLKKLIQFPKNFFRKNSELYALSEEEIQKFCQKSLITVSDSSAPRPCMTFQQAGFPKYLLQIISDQHFVSPTPIQSACWPCILQGRDVIGLAQTGSGKTLAYVLPAIVHITAQPLPGPGEGPIVLVLAPTRELAEQIQKEFNRFGESTQISTVALFGGMGKNDQARELARLTQVAVATPGRLIDFIVSKKINLSRVTYLVLDEADKMLDMGLGPQIRAIISQIRPDRQTLLFSATWPAEVQALGAALLLNPIRVDIGGTQTLTAAENITQSFEFCDEGEKPRWFAHFISHSIHHLRSLAKERSEAVAAAHTSGSGSKAEAGQGEGDDPDGGLVPRILVFCTTKAELQTVAGEWADKTIPFGTIHGDKRQEERREVLESFRHGSINVLIATDVAARGLDIPDISFVVNYSFPTFAFFICSIVLFYQLY